MNGGSCYSDWRCDEWLFLACKQAGEFPIVVLRLTGACIFGLLFQLEKQKKPGFYLYPLDPYPPNSHWTRRPQNLMEIFWKSGKIRKILMPGKNYIFFLIFLKYFECFQVCILGLSNKRLPSKLHAPRAFIRGNTVISWSRCLSFIRSTCFTIQSLNRVGGGYTHLTAYINCTHNQLI